MLNTFLWCLQPEGGFRHRNRYQWLPNPCRSLVDEVEVALEICKGADGSVDRREVERKVRALFHSEEGTTVRQNAQVMRQLAIESVGIKGSTYKNMQALVALIKGTWS